MKPSAGSAGVEGVLVATSSPVSSSKATTSVKVPPVSTPTRIRRSGGPPSPALWTGAGIPGRPRLPSRAGAPRSGGSGPATAEPGRSCARTPGTRGSGSATPWAGGSGSGRPGAGGSGPGTLGSGGSGYGMRLALRRGVRERRPGRAAQVVEVALHQVQVAVGEVVEALGDAGAGGDGGHGRGRVEAGAAPALVGGGPGHDLGDRGDDHRGAEGEGPGRVGAGGGGGDPAHGVV